MKKLIIPLIIGGVIVVSGKEAFAKSGDIDPEYCIAIIKAVKKQNPELAYMSTALVMGHIAAESSFRTGVISSAGAVGLMQVKPSTYDWLKQIYPDFGWQNNGLENPIENILAGMAFKYWIDTNPESKNSFIFARIQMYNTGVNGYLARGYRAQDYAIKVLSYATFWLV